MTTENWLLQGIRGDGDPAHARWLDDAMARVRNGTQMQLLEMYTAASRRIGCTPLCLPARPAGAGIPDAVTHHWTLEDAARLLLLHAWRAGAANPDEFTADTIACYEQGDTREQISWLRGVALLPDAARFLPLVTDACRTNILPLFEAIACENVYPSTHFPAQNFNQLVLKALFNNVALRRIVGLHERANPDLARMASDYAAERRAAGRTVPADIGLAGAGAEHSHLQAHTAAAPERQS